jgi:molybdopterin molybdotransferase
MAVSLQTARDRVHAACRPLPTEVVPVADALGRVLAAPLRARADLPPFANSAMDGYAVISGPAGRTLRVIGHSLAGTPSGTPVDETTAIRIATGAALPPGADAVVADERATLTDGRVELHADAPPGLNVRVAGEDIPAGRRLLHAGARLGPVELAVAIGTGHGELVCHRRPRVAILGTGDELRTPGSRLGAGQIHDSNTTTLAALATLAGGRVVARDRIADDPAATLRAVAAAIDGADLVVLSGGVSVGPEDHVRAALLELGVRPEFSGVEVRPGRPAWFGTRAGVPVFAVPGNPVAAIVIFILLGRPGLAALAGRRPPVAAEHARLTERVRPAPGRTNIVGAKLPEQADGRLLAAPTGPLSPHATGRLLGLDALALIPAGEAWLEAGTPVEILRISD